jgi:hypothetical protein
LPEAGVAVRWCRTGEGNIGIDSYIKKFIELCPGRALSAEVIVQPQPRMFDVRDPKFWGPYKNTPAWEYERFIELAEKSTARRDGSLNPLLRACRPLLSSWRSDLSRSAKTSMSRSNTQKSSSRVSEKISTFPNPVQRESVDDVIYDPSRLRGISALAMPSQDLNITPYSPQPVVRAPHRCDLRMAQRSQVGASQLKDQERQLAKQLN